VIIVIGASGFLGSYLVDRLVSEGNRVVAVGRNKLAREYYERMGIPFVTLDVTKAKDFEKLPHKEIEAVVLLAATLPANVKNYDALEYVQTNIIGTVNTAEFCRKAAVRKLISTTTYADVQNLWDEKEPIRESNCRDFKYTGDHSMYVISKNCATDIIEHYSQQYGIQGVVFRLPMVYGAGPHGAIYVDGEYYKSGIQTFIEAAMEGKQIEIWGDGKVARDIVYVKDVVKAFILALKSDRAHGLYNIASGVSVSLANIVSDVIDVFSTKSRSKVAFVDKANSARSFVFDISRAKTDFDYVPDFVPFKKMLLDYKKELEICRFGHLIEGRKKDRS
jgi:UDP-glucose 4-epimerase